MQEEFIRLYTGIYKDLYRFALYTLHNSADAEDAVSDTVLDAYEGFPKLRDKGAFKSWMFAILSVKCRRRLKEYTDKTVELPDGTADEDGNVTYPKQLVSVPSGEAEKMDLWNAFGSLDERERLIIALSVIGGYEGKEIARELSMNHSTVRTVRRRALMKLKGMLEYRENLSNGQ